MTAATRFPRAFLICCLLAALSFAWAAPLQAAQADAQKTHKTQKAKKKTVKHAAAKKKSGLAPLAGKSPKYAHIVMDAQTGQILSQDQPDKIVHPASLTKMMTLAVTFQALNDGRASLNDRVRISAFAHSMPASKLDLKTGSTIRLQDAIYAIVTNSSNDIAVALGEHIGGGSHGAFVGMMNRMAANLGMRGTNYANASGLHNLKQVTTARDQAMLARAMLYRYPQYYHYFSAPSFAYNGRVYANHNHLMETYPGMDGIKTGYIIPSGFNLVASAKQSNRRLIGVVFGGTSAKGRDAQMRTLLDDAFARSRNIVAGVAASPAYVRPEAPVRLADNQAAATTDGAQRWAQLAPMLEDKAVSRVIGQTDAQAGQANDPRVLTRPAASPPAAPRDMQGIMPAAGMAASASAAPRPTTPMRLALAAQQSAAMPITAPTAAPPTGQGGYIPNGSRVWAIQVGAFSSRIQADRAVQASLQQLPLELRHVTPSIAPLQTAQGTIFRGRLQGLSRGEAVAACGTLGNCLTVSPYAD